MLGAGEDKKAKSEEQESSDDVELHTPAVFFSNVASDYRAEADS